ncbi:hypothetical protein [Streptomyces sp. NPDC001070]
MDQQVQRVDGDRVTTLGPAPVAPATVAEVPGPAEVIREFDLVLVDRCSLRCEDAPAT